MSGLNYFWLFLKCWGVRGHGSLNTLIRRDKQQGAEKEFALMYIITRATTWTSATPDIICRNLFCASASFASLRFRRSAALAAVSLSRNALATLSNPSCQGKAARGKNARNTPSVPGATAVLVRGCYRLSSPIAPKQKDSIMMNL